MTRSQASPPAGPPLSSQPTIGTDPPTNPRITIQAIDTTENVPTSEPRTVESGSVVRSRGRSSRGCPCDSIQSLRLMFPQFFRFGEGPPLHGLTTTLKEATSPTSGSSLSAPSGQQQCRN